MTMGWTCDQLARVVYADGDQVTCDKCAKAGACLAPVAVDAAPVGTVVPPPAPSNATGATTNG